MYLNQSILWYFDSLGKDSSWINDPFIDHNINISKYNPVAGSIYFKLPKELNHSKMVWIIFKILMIMNALNGIYSDSWSVSSKNKKG